MCGRFSITGDLDFYAEYFAVDEVLTEPLEQSWNVAPTDPVYVVTQGEGSRSLRSMSWGLLPLWAKDARSIHINARAETVATSPSFRESFTKRRCLIPADGFYEWEAKKEGGTPHWVYRADGHPMVFAGIWAPRRDADTQQWDRTCSILTTGAEGVVAPIHDRMPLALHPDLWGAWLDGELPDPGSLLFQGQQVDADELMEHPVSRKVNSVKNNGPELREKSERETLF